MPQDYREIVRAAMNGRTITWLSETADVPLSTLTQWLGGRLSTMRIEYLQAVAAALSLELRPVVRDAAPKRGARR